MPFVYHTGFESGDLSEVSSSTGTPTVTSGSAKTGTYKLVCTASSATVYVTLPSITIRRISFWLLISSTPAAETTIFGNDTSGGRIRLNTSNQILFYDGTTLRGTSSAISGSTWVRICCGVAGGATTDWLLVNDGNLGVITGVTVAAFNATCRMGVITSTTATLWFDDLAVDDTFSTTDVGDIGVTAAVPRAAGTYSAWSYVGSANHWDNVEEITYSDSDYNYYATAANANDSYLITSCANMNIPSAATIAAVRVMSRMSRAANTLRAVHNQLVRDNATDYVTAVSPTTSYVWYFIYYANRPSGSAWDQTSVDAFEIGGRHTSAYAQQTNLSATYAMVAFKRPILRSSSVNVRLLTTSIGTNKFLRIISEILRLVSDIRSKKSFTKIINYTVRLYDSYIKSNILVKILNLTERLIDSQIRSINLRRLVADNINLIDTNYKVVRFIRILSDDLRLISTILASKKLVKRVTDNLYLLETSRKQFARIVSEILRLYETSKSVNIYRRIISYPLRLVDTQLASVKFIRRVSESESIVTTIKTSNILIRGISDNVRLVESIISRFTFNRIINEAQNIITNAQKKLVGEAIPAIIKVVRSKRFIRW